MTPGARLQAAIEILETILAGQPPEAALTGWARRSRFAGSKDRAAIRDHVFDALRCRRSLAALGGAETGRGLILGLARRDGLDLGALFTGPPYAPDPPRPEEIAAARDPEPGAEALDLPDWLWPEFCASLGARAETVARALQARAPVHLRVNTRKTSRPAAQERLAAEGITCAPLELSPGALEVRVGARRIRGSACYREGWVELQDAASQAVVDRLPLADGMRVLDYCAGGGGKALAMAARARIRVLAHDAAPARMRDIPARAARAGVTIEILPPRDRPGAGTFDLVLCDAPCSGSGSWRRNPGGKWRLDPDALAALTRTQAQILTEAAAHVRPGGWLGYVTCSVLACENNRPVADFLAAHPGWALAARQDWQPGAGGDGFHLSLLSRP